MGRPKGSKNKIIAPIEVTPDVKVTAIIFGKRFTSSGETVFEALARLKPGIKKGRTILTVERGDKKRERILSPVATIRLFNTYGMVRDLLLRKTSSLFDI